MVSSMIKPEVLKRLKMRKVLVFFVVFAIIDYCTCTVGSQSGVRSDLSSTTEPETVLTVVRAVNGKAILQCFNDQNVTIPNATWTKNNQPFTESPPRVVMKNGSVFFHPALPEDDGFYQCGNSAPLQFVAQTSAELHLMLTFEGHGCQTFNTTGTLKNMKLNNKLEAVLKNSIQYTVHLNDMLLHCLSHSVGTVVAKVQGLQAVAVVKKFVNMTACGDIGKIKLHGTNITFSIPSSNITCGLSPPEEDEDESALHQYTPLVIFLVIAILLLLTCGSIIFTSLYCLKEKRRKGKTQHSAQQSSPTSFVPESLPPDIQVDEERPKKAYISAFSNIYGSSSRETEYCCNEEILNSLRMHEQVFEIDELVCEGLQSAENITGENGSVATCRECECENLPYARQGCKCGLAYRHFLNTETQGSCTATTLNGAKEQFSCDDHGTEYHNKTHGIHIVFPQGAVPEGVTVKIDLDIMLTGPLNFPDNMKAVSPILWICVVGCPDFQFLKPVSVTLPHFLDLSCDSDLALLQPCFMKASHGLKQSQQLTFHPMNQSKAIYPLQSSSATVNTDHFCYLCIAANAPNPAIQSRTRYYFASWVPRSLGECQSWDVVFSISYFLPTCIKAMDELYSNSHKKHHDIFKFAENSDKLEIDYCNELPGGWQLTLQSSPEVYYGDVDYSQYDSETLKYMHSLKLYPPQFVLNVSRPYNVRTGTIAIVQFKGAEKVLRRELPLQLPALGTMDQRMDLSQSLPSLPFSEQDNSASAIGSSEPLKHQWDIDVHCSQPSTLQTQQSTNTLTACFSSSAHDTPTDKELLHLACEIPNCLGPNWESLFVHLNLDYSVLAEVNASTSSIKMRVFKLLCEWRQQNVQNSKLNLARCLQGDPHLTSIASQLMAGSITNLTPSSSMSSLKSISSCSSTSSSNSQKRSSLADHMEQYMPPAKLARPEPHLIHE